VATGYVPIAVEHINGTLEPLDADNPSPAAKFQRDRCVLSGAHKYGAAETRVPKTCQYIPPVRATFRRLLPRIAAGKSAKKQRIS
jgi:hypothetical protein